MPLRIAIASTGLGHVSRGVESWANDLATALHRTGADVSLFQGGGRGPEPWRHTLACMRRFEAPAARVLSVTKQLRGWSYGLGSGYEVEQTTFAYSLWRRIRNDYDILHVQDPLLALRMQRLHERGWSRPRVILAHGTEESVETLQKYAYLQHLAPCYLGDWEQRRPARQSVFAIPNFVDTDLLRPHDQAAARAEWNLPQDALIVLSVAALKKAHKRCDYLIREFAEFRKSYPGPAILVMAGAREKETPEIAELGRALLGDSVRILESVDRRKIPSLYRAADIYAIASLHEMMPIAVLEALSSGLPVSCNRTATLEWMTGPGGAIEDISAPGGLRRQWERLANPATRSAMGAAARRHAEDTFSEGVVVAQIEAMYETVGQGL